MCGGIAAALNLGGHRSAATTVAYHGGRITSYTALGGLVGLAAGSVDIAAWTMALRYIAGALLIGRGLYIADWWRGMVWLERAGSALWRPLQKFSSRLLPIRTWYQGFSLGLFWGLELVRDPDSLEPVHDAFSPPAGPTAKQAVLAAAMERGVYCMPGAASVIMLAPPLPVTAEQIQRGLAVIDEALDEADRLLDRNDRTPR